MSLRGCWLADRCIIHYRYRPAHLYLFTCRRYSTHLANISPHYGSSTARFAANASLIAPASALRNFCLVINSFITSSQVAVQSIVISVHVCLSVCLFVFPHAYFKNHTSECNQIFCTRYLWPWLNPRHTLPTFSFVDDVTFT